MVYVVAPPPHGPVNTLNEIFRQGNKSIWSKLVKNECDFDRGFLPHPVPGVPQGCVVFCSPVYSLCVPHSWSLHMRPWSQPRMYNNCAVIVGHLHPRYFPDIIHCFWAYHSPGDVEVAPWPVSGKLSRSRSSFQSPSETQLRNNKL